MRPGLVLVPLTMGCGLDFDVDYVANLQYPLSPTDRGFAWLELAGDELDVHVRVNDLSWDQRADALIMGFDDPRVDAMCPGPEQDDGDHVIQLDDALAVSGDPRLVVAGAAPVDAAGNFDLDVTVDASDALPAESRVLVIVGHFLGEPDDLVVACGEIRLAGDGDPRWTDDPAEIPGIVGAGGLTADSGDPVALDVQLPCDAADFRQELDIRVGDDRTYTLAALETASCTDGTFTGTGVGVWKEVSAVGTGSTRAEVRLTLVDGGAQDHVDIDIQLPDAPAISGPLEAGDLEATGDPEAP